MSEVSIEKIEKEDIKVPSLENGDTAIVFQRHERYVRDRDAENTGSLIEEHAEAARDRDIAFFEKLFGNETSKTMVLFTSSDTQYTGGGYRSLETAQIAQDAAIKVLEKMGIDPSSRIINLSPDFITHGFKPTNQSIRPDTKIREPQIFDTPEYVDYLRGKYGKEDGLGTGLGSTAWAMHEMDAEKAVRKQMGAEGVYEILDRTKKSINVMDRYANVFHANNPDTALLIWAVSHYDTISPLVKDATGVSFGEYIPVDYGAGVVIELHKDEVPMLHAQGQEVELRLAATAIKHP
ncbi:MAG: hypothetical protein WAT17_01205 [Candidatus Saccharimonadales bacterium]|jgi:hypothetical protein